MSLRDKILNSKDIKKELVTIKEWDNAQIEIRTMSGKERSTLLKTAVDKDGNLDFEKMYPLIIISTAYDPTTQEKLFTIEDRDILNTKSAKCVEEIAKVALRLAGLDGESGKVIEKN
jgi:hypothetical protein